MFTVEAHPGVATLGTSREAMTVSGTARTRGILAAALALVAVLAAVLVVASVRPADRTASDEEAVDGAPEEAVDAPEEPAAERTPMARPNPDWLLPNMRSLPARRLQVVGSGDDRSLRFDAWLANVGVGPMVVRPGAGAGRCPVGQRPAHQLIQRDADGDGAFRRGVDPASRSRFAGCMLDHPTHDHWHFDAMAAYLLLPEGEDDAVAQRAKVSFCLRDNERVPGGGSGVDAPRAFFGDCSRNRPQGISPGWVDVYDRTLDGQSLRLPADARGAYCLRLEADPDDLLLESDETDNDATIGIRLRGPEVTVDHTIRC